MQQLTARPPSVVSKRLTLGALALVLAGITQLPRALDVVAFTGSNVAPIAPEPLWEPLTAWN